MDYPRLNPSVLKNPTLASTFYDQLQEAINRELEQLGKIGAARCLLSGAERRTLSSDRPWLPQPLPDQALWQERTRRTSCRSGAYELGAVAARCREGGNPQPEAHHRLRRPIIEAHLGRSRPIAPRTLCTFSQLYPAPQHVVLASYIPTPLVGRLMPVGCQSIQDCGYGLGRIASSTRLGE